MLSMVAAFGFYRRWWRRSFRFRTGGGCVFWSELHKALGLWSLWFVVLMGGTGGWYLLTGTYLHARRLETGAGVRGRHRWPGTGGAILVSFGLVVATVVSGLDQAREVYGPTVEGVAHLPELAPGVKAVIIAWCGLTLAIVTAWVFLLWFRGSGSPARATERDAPAFQGLGRS